MGVGAKQHLLARMRWMMSRRTSTSTSNTNIRKRSMSDLTNGTNFNNGPSTSSNHSSSSNNGLKRSSNNSSNGPLKHRMPMLWCSSNSRSSNNKHLPSPRNMLPLIPTPKSSSLPQPCTMQFSCTNVSTECPLALPHRTKL